MEEREGLNGLGVAPKSDGAHQSYRVEPNPEPFSVSGSAAPAAAAAAGLEVKKKRGRPRKYAGDGPVAALSPMPISASIPLTGDYSSAWKPSSGRPVDSSSKKKHKLDFGNSGGMMPYPVGGGGSGTFTPHVMTVNTGEDINMKIISFSQQGSRAICVLAANGTISNVTLRQANSSGGTLTYEGRFEILSLSGSFIPSDNGLTKSRSGGMSVSLAGPDGRVLGGGLAGMLVAAGPVQLVIASFIPGQHQQEQKPKKPKYEHTITFGPVSPNPISEDRRYEGGHISQKPNVFGASASFHGDKSTHHIKIADVEHNIILPGEDSREHSHEITC